MLIAMNYFSLKHYKFKNSVGATIHTKMAMITTMSIKITPVVFYVKIKTNVALIFILFFSVFYPTAHELHA